MSNKWTRLIIPLLLLPGLAGLFYTFQRMDNSNIDTPEAPTTLPRYTVNGAELTRFDVDGGVSLYGQAEAIDYFDDQSGRAQNLQLDLLDDEEKTWHVTAPAANLPAHQRRFMLEGPVVANGHWPDNGEAVAIHTDRLWIDPDRHEVDTDAPVELHSPLRNGNAVGLRSDWAEQTLQLLHNVHMIYTTGPHEAAH
ncbi:MAG: export transporter periplasmic protein LptC [Nevskia sp.]|nr:export transporter periplasmic protein LptC [Nevskia sp.]